MARKKAAKRKAGKKKVGATKKTAKNRALPKKKAAKKKRSVKRKAAPRRKAARKKGARKTTPTHGTGIDPVSALIGALIGLPIIILTELGKAIGKAVYRNSERGKELINQTVSSAVHDSDVTLQYVTAFEGFSQFAPDAIQSFGKIEALLADDPAAGTLDSDDASRILKKKTYNALTKFLRSQRQLVTATTSLSDDDRTDDGRTIKLLERLRVASRKHARSSLHLLSLCLHRSSDDDVARVTGNRWGSVSEIESLLKSVQ